MDEQAIRERLRDWRHAHPQASFDEIEDAVQQEIVRLQAQLVDEVIQTAKQPAEQAAAAESRPDAAPVCEPCGRRMQRCGQRARTVLSRMGQPIPLERDYFVCPACGAGLFPPR